MKPRTYFLMFVHFSFFALFQTLRLYDMTDDIPTIEKKVTTDSGKKCQNIWERNNTGHREKRNIE